MAHSSCLRQSCGATKRKGCGGNEVLSSAGRRAPARRVRGSTGKIARQGSAALPRCGIRFLSTRSLDNSERTCHRLRLPISLGRGLRRCGKTCVSIAPQKACLRQVRKDLFLRVRRRGGARGRRHAAAAARLTILQAEQTRKPPHGDSGISSAHFAPAFAPRAVRRPKLARPPAGSLRTYAQPPSATPLPSSSLSRSTATTRSPSAVLNTITPRVWRPMMLISATPQRISWPPSVTSMS
jgi:hypothetical protein